MLVQRPWLVLLDEPAAGMTGEEIERLVGVIQRDQPDRGGDRRRSRHGSSCACWRRNVTVFHHGAILVEGPAERVLDDARVREVYIGNRAK